MVTFDALLKQQESVAVVGLGYVGLPLACALAKHFRTIGFDINEARVKALSTGQDRTGETSPEELQSAPIHYTCNPEDLAQASLLIIAVPTPIDEHRSPDLRPVISATKTVGQNMRKNCVVVYESTVYPGLTEEICVPLLEHASKMRFGSDFSVGYSPERVNPGDKVHRLETVVKIVSGSDPATTELLAQVYGKVTQAGIHKASSIKVAEAAKVIENTQRDLNIALMNELAIIFERMHIDTTEVLAAAGTKWNFLPFKPGLVGGHCIGVDPYYLTFKAEELGFHPEVILAGRRINDNMGKYLAQVIVKRMLKRGCSLHGARVGILGFTFKENVPDLRNSRVADLVAELQDFGLQTIVTDVKADPEEALKEYGQQLVPLPALRNLDALVLAVAHREYGLLTAQEIQSFFSCPAQGLVADIKALFDPVAIRATGLDYWRL